VILEKKDETVYDVIIVGGGIAGLTTAYMLRDKNILILEKENRLGGRVESEKVHEATNNIGTQFFSDGDSSFADLLDELDIKRHTPNLTIAPLALYLSGKFYPDAKTYINTKVVFQAVKMIFKNYRKYLVSKLPMDDPRWKKLAALNTEDLQNGMGPEILSPLNAFLRGACLSKPERTSGIMGVGFMGGVADSGEMAFVDGGFQKITDAMVCRLNGKFNCNSEVQKVEEADGIVSVSYRQSGKEYVLKSKAVVMAAPAPLALKLLPTLPESKKRALSMIKYGPITVVSLFLDKTIPWKRFVSLLSDSSLFQGIMDQTLGTAEENNPENPILYNFIISHYPDETKEIEEFMSKTDEEIIKLTINDFKKIIPEAGRIEDYVSGSKVTRYPIGELELSPEYYLEALPHLQKPIGNIHFCGDYTEAESFIDGSVASAFRVARELGSTYVVSEKNEKRYSQIPKWGKWGLSTLRLNLLLLICGILLTGVYGVAITVAAAVLFITTLVLPSFFPPFKQIYQLLFTLSAAFGGIVSLLTLLI